MGSLPPNREFFLGERRLESAGRLEWARGLESAGRLESVGRLESARGLESAGREGVKGRGVKGGWEGRGSQGEGDGRGADGKRCGSRWCDGGM